MTGSRIAGTLALLITLTIGAVRTTTAVPSAPSPPSLTGRVTSKAEGPMEGVVVIAQQQGKTVFASVSTDATGRFQFPRNRVGAGTYSITIRAAGYVLEGAGVASVEVGTKAPATFDLRLTQATPDQFAHQLADVDWYNSMPGTPAQKDLLVRKLVNCGFCHEMERTLRSRYTAEQMLSVIQRMNTYGPDNTAACGPGSVFVCDGTTLGRVQLWSSPWVRDGSWWGADAKELAQYLASVNLSGGQSTWAYPLKAMPRPRGKASRAVVTVYPIPRQPSVIHDLDVDSKGNVWYGDSGWGYLSKFDPKTGTFSEYPAPKNRTASPGFEPILGVQDVQVDTKDNVWAVIGGGSMAYFDTKQERWYEFKMPATPWEFLTPFYSRHTETVWTTGWLPGQDGPGPLQAFRLNYKKGTVDATFPIMVDQAGKDFSHVQHFNFYGFRDPMLPFCYQIDRDPNDNFICADFYGSNIITVNSRTGVTHVYATPTAHSGPRRGHADEAGRFWFAEFFTDKIALLDPKTASIKEFPLSTKYMQAYAAAPDKRGNVWTSSMGSDRVVRLDPRTGDSTEYLMPVYYDARTVRIDRSASTTTVWLPNKNLAQLIRIEVPE